METINTKQIIEAVMEEVKDFPRAAVKFADIPAGNDEIELLSYNVESMLSSLQTLRSASNIPWYRSVGGGFTGFMKKVIRKCVTFIVAPIAEEQATYNACMERTIEQLYSLVLIQQKRIDALEGKNED